MKEPKIALAQIASDPGSIESNVKKHLWYIQRAADAGADLIAFPELSITGYEPGLASQLAADPSDVRWDAFQVVSNRLRIQILAGMPILIDGKIRIAALIFTPNEELRLYFKSFLHPDEEPFFSPGKNDQSVFFNKFCIAPAICYEISVADHISAAIGHQPSIYLVMVVKTARGIGAAWERMSGIASQFGIKTLLVNAVGTADGAVSVGQSAAWDREGQLINSLNGVEEGLLFC